MVAALLLVLAAACQPEASPTPHSTIAAPDVSAPPPPLAAAWRPVDLPDGRGKRYAAGVIADSDGFVVYGGSPDRPIAWSSADAITWEAEALPGGEGSPTKAAASADVTVLLGGGSTSRCAHPFAEFLWRRAAGDRNWEAVPFNPRLFCAGGSAAIAANAQGFMVAGMGTGDVPFAWSSADGLDWQDRAVGLPLEAPPPWALAATEEEFIELGRGERTEVRMTAEGQEWRLVPAPPVAPAFNPDGPGMSPAVLLATPGGALAVYQADDASVRSAWLRQADGTWALIELDGVAAGRWVSGGTTIGDVACLFVTRSGGSAAVLVSADLATWRELSIPAVRSVLALARFDGALVLVVAGNREHHGPNPPLVFLADAAVLRTE
jgi:hypothetical protein